MEEIANAGSRCVKTSFASGKSATTVSRCTRCVGSFSTKRAPCGRWRSEEHTSELQSLRHLVCRLLLEKKKISILMVTVYTSQFDKRRTLFHDHVVCGLLMINVRNLEIQCTWMLIHVWIERLETIQQRH